MMRCILATVVIAAVVMAADNPGYLPMMPPGIHVGAVYESPTDPAVKKIVDQGWFKTIGAGADLYQLSLMWSDLEPTQGMLNVTILDQILIDIVSIGAYPLLNVAVINTNAVSVPYDLRDPNDDTKLAPGLAWDSVELLERYAALLEAVLPLTARHGAAYLGLGNEVDGLLGIHTEYRAPFTKFVDIACKWVRNATHPMPFACGVTVMYAGLTKYASASWFQALQATTDLTPVTYYPLTTGFDVQDPTAPLRDIPLMVKLLPVRMALVLQEAGYPSGWGNSSSVDNSTQTKQAEFVDNVFAALRALNGTASWIPGGNPVRAVSLFKLNDWTYDQCKFYASYYHVTDLGFLEYLCTLGMGYTSLGVEKLGYTAYMNGLLSLK
jgi:hypothetical protein